MPLNELGTDDWSLPLGVDVASRGALAVALVVWALSFATAGETTWQSVARMRGRGRQLRAAAADRRVIVSRGGRAFAWWQRLEGAWLLQEIAALPRGRGHGTRILEAFLDLADKAYAPVVLVCPPERVAWYERHGFRTCRGSEDADALGLISMARPGRPRQNRAARRRAAHRPAGRPAAR